MSTIKQNLALEKMVENGGNVSQAMRDVGYSENTAKTPQKLTESIGFMELCEDKGLTNDLLVSALIEDIKTKKGNRKAELELGFKIKGHLVQKTGNGDKNANDEVRSLRIVFDRTFKEKEDNEKVNKLIDNCSVTGR